MNFKACNRSQSLLLPPSYEAFLGESHEAIMLAEFIDELSLSSLERAYENEHGGRSAYHPVMLMTVLIYGYMNGTFSSRKIAKCLRQDLAYMYLAAGSTPDFRTLARFRKEKGDDLALAMKEVVRKAHDLGLVAFGIVSLDGTKIQANAAKSGGRNSDAFLKRAQDILQEAERVDVSEDAQYGDEEDAGSPDIKTREGRMKKKCELEQARKESAASQKTSSDPDARLMKMKRGDFANGYNVQIMAEQGLVLASHVANTSADQGLLVPTVRTFKEMHGTSPIRLLADKGYSSEANHRFCEEERIDAYIPIHQEPADLTKYAYDEAGNVYTNREGHRYRFKQRMNRRGNQTILYEYVNQRTRKKKYLCVTPGWQRYTRQQREKLTSSEGRQIYKQRRWDVEGVFARIKHNLRFTSFRLRGFNGVRNEWNLISLAHNLKRMI
jgi:transposase